jgi:SnoaL-like domain
MAATRSPQEVFNHHAQALGAEDLEEIVADYSDDAIFITPAGVLRGKDGIRQAFTKLLGEIPQATWDLKTTTYEDDILFLEGTPRAAATASRTPSTPSCSATASSGCRPSATPSNLPADGREVPCARTSSSTPRV